eukprot:TRINITY_DN1975_c1_g2_i1.p1 TRINITY_DN1975_c1_g2~~TRINITY_DN1975_c1_g2_i1.p1  ORF type:complete len:477 (+),score=67.79 TRINITY_DN1975_c1_g2_i1:2131-3561(+)
MEITSGLWIAGMAKMANMEWLASIGAEVVVPCGSAAPVHRKRFTCSPSGNFCSTETKAIIKSHLSNPNKTTSSVVLYGDKSSCAATFLEYQLIESHTTLKESLQLLLSKGDFLPTKEQLHQLGVKELNILNLISINEDFELRQQNEPASECSDGDLRKMRIDLFRKGERTSSTGSLLNDLKQITETLAQHCGDSDQSKKRAFYLGISESRFLTDSLGHLAEAVCLNQNEWFQSPEGAAIISIIDLLSFDSRIRFQTAIRSVIGLRLLSSLRTDTTDVVAESCNSIALLLRDQTQSHVVFSEYLREFISSFTNQQYPMILSPTWAPVVEQAVKPTSGKKLTWGLSPSDLPTALQDIGHTLSKNFQSTHGGKRVSMMTFLGEVHVRYMFEASRSGRSSVAACNLIVSVPTAAILLLFNSVDDHTEESITSSLPWMQHNDLVASLNPLLRSRILIKRGESFILNPSPKLCRKMNLLMSE